jgi:hypothetical protein
LAKWTVNHSLDAIGKSGYSARRFGRCLLRTLLFLLFALPGCGGLTRFADVADDTVQVNRVNPDHGDVGTVVTIRGDGFEGPVDVYFDGYPAMASVVDAKTVQATAPDASGLVDVTVITENGESTLVGAFTYGDAGFIGFDDEDSGALSGGGVGGLVEVTHLQTACPECFGTTEIDVTASAVFHDPASGSWMDGFPALGGCDVNGAASPLADSYTDVGDFVYLTAGSKSLVLKRTQSEGGPKYTAQSTDTYDFARSAFYDLQAPDGGDMGPIDLTDVLLTPSGFDSIEPWDMLYTSSQSAFSASVSKSYAALSWSPAGADQIRVIVTVFDGYSGSYLGSVDCRDYDNGYFVVPPQSLSSFPAYSLLGIYIFRVSNTEMVMGNNGATVEGVSSMGVLGTATLTP